MAQSDSEYYDEEQTGECQMSSTTGMPYMDEDEADDKVRSSVMTFPAFLVVPRILGAGIALGIYFMHKDRYEDRMKRQVQQFEGIGWLFLSGAVLGLLVSVANMMPTVWKAGVMPGNAGNLRANMAIYKVNHPTNGKQLPYVVMENEGRIGNYNRANRAMSHFVEYGIQVAVCILLAGLIFGEAVFVLTVIYAVTRIWYQYAYTTGGYGRELCQHGVPFMLHSVLTAPALELLVWVAGVRMIAIASAAEAGVGVA